MQESIPTTVGYSNPVISQCAIMPFVMLYVLNETYFGVEYYDGIFVLAHVSQQETRTAPMSTCVYRVAGSISFRPSTPPLRAISAQGGNKSSSLGRASISTEPRSQSPSQSSKKRLSNHPITTPRHRHPYSSPQPSSWSPPSRPPPNRHTPRPAPSQPPHPSSPHP